MRSEGNKNTIHSLIKELAKEFNVSQKNLAESIGMRQSHLSLFLNGKLDLNSKKFTQLLKMFEIDLEQMLLEKLNRLSTSSNSQVSDSVKVKLNMERLSEEYRGPILKIIESLAG